MAAPLGNTLARTWPDSHIAALRELFAADMSHAKIADAINDRFGTSYTRNATIGKATRLGLLEADRPRPVKSAAKPRVRPKPKPAPAPLSAAIPQFHRDNLAGLRCAEVEPMNIALVDLEPHHCRWPIGGWPDATPVRFCGQSRWEGSSYCGSHTVLSTGQGTRAEQMAVR
jgi:GcrA cell cycle regulator